jgi:peptidoglycan/LPS O-acetylase OafA/YrhL
MRASTAPADRAASGGEAEVPHAPGFSYKPALDGIRAVAVLSVIAYHFGEGWAPGGFLGVDMFFVLSGYLITTLLVIEWGRSNAIDLIAFWARRARRLLPALFLVLAAVAIWAALEAHSDQLNGIRSDSIWSLFYGANWHLIDTAQSYFTMVREASPLRHMWSLAIEEQFYLVWPLVAFACLKLARGKRWLIATVCVAGIAGSAWWMAHIYSPSDQSRAYYGTDARAAQLLVGALLALVLLHWSPKGRAQRRVMQAIGVVGAVVCVWFFVSVDDRNSDMYRGGFLLFAVAVAALIASVVQRRRTPIHAALSLKPVIWIGSISYGLYLWHWPVVVAVTPDTLGRGGWQLSAVRLALTFGFAALSFYLVEKPIRYGSWSRGRTGIALAAAGGFATAVIIVVATSGGTPLPSYLVADPNKPVAQHGPAPTVPPKPVEAQLGVSRMLLVGDSIAGNLGQAMGETAAEHGVTLTTVARPACGLTTAIPETDGDPLFWAGACAARAVDYENNAVQDAQPNVVLWLSIWEGMDMKFPDGTSATFDTPAWKSGMFYEWEAARNRLEATGAKLVFLTLPRRADGIRPPGIAPDEAERRVVLNEMYHEFAALHPSDVTVADLAHIVCPSDDSCPDTTPDGIELRPRDGDHYEGDGPAWVAPRLYAEVIRALKTMPGAPQVTSSPTPARATSSPAGTHVNALVGSK